MKKISTRIKKSIGLMLLVCLNLCGCRENRTETISSFDTAMGTIISQTLYVRGEQKEAYLKDILEEINSCEAQISKRIETSEISRMNEGSLTEVSKELRQCLETVLDVSSNSDGALDVSIGNLVDLWNIDEVLNAGEELTVPTKEEIYHSISDTGYDKIIINGNKIELSGAVKLDLGAVGKGYACDRIYQRIVQNKDIQAGVVSVGGSVLTYGTKPGGEPFNIAIPNPRAEGEYLGAIRVSGGKFISTSGDYERFVFIDGKRYHHIMDPKTGYPAESGLCSVTIVCDSGLLSDCLSTACFVLGKDKGMELAEKYNVEALFVDEDLNLYMTSGMESMFHQ